jgi:hypothetical protein
MPSRGSRDHIERNPYQPEPQELGKLAPALGLQESAGLEAIREKLEHVLSRAEAIKLGDSGQDRDRVEALQVVNDSYKRAKLGFFSFNAQILPTGGRSFTQVADLLRNLVQMVEASERYVAPPTSKHSGAACELAALTPPAQPTNERFRGYHHDSTSHISQAVDEVLDRARRHATSPEPAPVARLREALQYLKEQKILPPDAVKENEPAAAPTLALLRHGMVWVWNTRGTCSWDPRLATGRNQSLFTAAPQYFQQIPPQRSQAKQELLDVCLRIREEQDYASRHLRKSDLSKDTIDLLLLRSFCAEEITGTSPTEHTLQRWEALYRFLRATETKPSSR